MIFLEMNPEQKQLGHPYTSIHTAETPAEHRRALLSFCSVVFSLKGPMCQLILAQNELCQKQLDFFVYLW